MQQALARPLLAGEHVHHLNGNIQDNRLENLALTSSHLHHHDFHAGRAEIWHRHCDECDRDYEILAKIVRATEKHGSRHRFCGNPCRISYMTRDYAAYRESR